jgi:hypothetical protein
MWGRDVPALRDSSQGGRSRPSEAQMTPIAAPLAALAAWSRRRREAAEDARATADELIATLGGEAAYHHATRRMRDSAAAGDDKENARWQRIRPLIRRAIGHPGKEDSWWRGS